MIETTLPNGRKTDRLAFGCAGVGGSLDYAASRKLLITAWEAGFRHFDTAPSYGMGMSEAYLGRFLKEVGATDATITTKVGIAKPAAVSGSKRLVMSVVRPILNQVPAIRRKLGDRMRQGAARGQFSPEFIERSLDESLKALNVEQIDIYLMHELTREDLTDELERVVERAKAAGKIGSAGIGSRRQKFAALQGATPDIFEFFQTSWDWDNTALPRPPHGTANCHGALRAMGWLEAKLNAAGDRQPEIAAALNVDIGNPQSKADILLSMALADTGNGLVIAQSSKPARIAEIRLDKRIADPNRMGGIANDLFRRK